MTRHPFALLTLAALMIATSLLSGCASNDNPPCRRVSAAEFMRTHRFKSVVTDRFIGITRPISPRPNEDGSKAFKEIWEFGLFHGWAVLWIPLNELPKDYLAKMHSHIPPRR